MNFSLNKKRQRRTPLDAVRTKAAQEFYELDEYYKKQLFEQKKQFDMQTIQMERDHNIQLEMYANQLEHMNNVIAELSNEHKDIETMTKVEIESLRKQLELQKITKISDNTALLAQKELELKMLEVDESKKKEELKETELLDMLSPRSVDRQPRSKKLNNFSNKNGSRASFQSPPPRSASSSRYSNLPSYMKPTSASRKKSIE